MLQNYTLRLPRILLLFFLVFPFTLIQAQSPYTITKIVPRAVQPDFFQMNQRISGYVDTITDFYDRSTDFYLLSAGEGGYTLGTNSFTEEVGVHYTALNGVTKITELAVYFTHKQIMFGQADSIVAKAYTCTPDSMPDVVIGIGKKSVADLDTAGFLTFIPLTVLDSTSGDFFVSINYRGDSSINDTVVILSNNVLTSNGGPDGYGEKRTRQLASTGQWFRVWDIWNFGGANMDADAMILPIVDYNEIVGLKSGLVAGDLSLYRPFPNPSTSSVKVPFSLKSSQKVRLTVFDISGKPVMDTGLLAKNAGEQSIELDLGSLAFGTYYFILNAQRGVLAGKFIKVD